MSKHPNLNAMKARALAVFSLLVVLSISGSVTAGTHHGNLALKSNSDFTACMCVSGGSGTAGDPYRLTGLTLISQTGPGILVDNSSGTITKYFDITGDTVTGSNGPPTSHPGIEFVDVNRLGEITGTTNTFSGNQYGILLDGSSHILIDGGSSNGATVNSNGIAGISVVGGGSNHISNLQVNHNGIGIPEGFLGREPDNRQHNLL